MAPAGDARARATVTVTIDNERDIAALNAWLRRWGPRIRCSYNQGCGCCMDVWRVEAPPEAFSELPADMVAPLPSAPA